MTLGWGVQLDVRPVRPSAVAQLEDADTGEMTDTALAGYIAKYATKTTGATDGADRPIRDIAHVEHLRISDHHRHMITTAWELGGLVQYEELNLRHWAHMLGFRGHFLSKSQHFFTTFKALRDQRRRWRLTAELAELDVPELSAFGAQLKSTGDRQISTTMAFVRILTTLLRDKAIGRHVVPIVPDESRTFGMEGLFRQFGIFSQVGQLYQPEDANQLMYYKEDKNGQMLQEGINEAGAMSSWIAAATSYSVSDTPMIPFYIYYSMFGFQRIGDLAWAAGDSRARGFLVGGTAGRTTLNGEGLQHEDGHSHVLSATIPNCVSYDPTFSYEVAVIVQDGLRRMYAEQEDVFYYLTVMNENYRHPAMPEGREDEVREGILRGMYLLREGQASPHRGKAAPRVQLLGSGTILHEVIAAADLLEQDFGVAADVWSVPSFTELGRDGAGVQRWNMLHPTQEQRHSFVQDSLAGRPAGPVVAATDYLRAFAEQIRPFVGRRYRVLGTDGFGRSDYRRALRGHFEVDRHPVALAALTELVAEGAVAASVAAQAVTKYGIDPDKPAPALA